MSTVELAGESALLIQSTWRGFAARQKVARWHAAAVILQKNMARFHVQRSLVRQKVAVWRIESAFAACKHKKLEQLRQRICAARVLQQVCFF